MITIKMLCFDTLLQVLILNKLAGHECAGGHEAAGKVIGDVLAGGFASKGLGRRGCDGEKQVPRCSREDTGALGPIALPV